MTDVPLIFVWNAVDSGSARWFRIIDLKNSFLPFSLLRSRFFRPATFLPVLVEKVRHKR